MRCRNHACSRRDEDTHSGPTRHGNDNVSDRLPRVRKLAGLAPAAPGRCAKLPRPNGQTGRTLWHGRGPHAALAAAHTAHTLTSEPSVRGPRIPALLLPNKCPLSGPCSPSDSQPASTARVLPVDRLDFRRESEQSQPLNGRQRAANRKQQGVFWILYRVPCIGRQQLSSHTTVWGLRDANEGPNWAPETDTSESP